MTSKKQIGDNWKQNLEIFAHSEAEWKFPNATLGNFLICQFKDFGFSGFILFFHIADRKLFWSKLSKSLYLKKLFNLKGFQIVYSMSYNEHFKKYFKMLQFFVRNKTKHLNQEIVTFEYRIVLLKQFLQSKI